MFTPEQKNYKISYIIIDLFGSNKFSILTICVCFCYSNKVAGMIMSLVTRSHSRQRYSYGWPQFSGKMI
jgi:hypothetical protein